MNWPLILFVGSVVFLPACSTTPKVNYHQAVQTDYSQTYSSLLTLKAVDSGDIAKTRQMLMVPVFLNLDSLRFYGVEGLVSLAPEERREWTTLARQTLNYVLLHRDAWDLRRLDVQAGVRGLRYLLTDLEDVQRLNELSDYLEAAGKKKSETGKP